MCCKLIRSGFYCDINLIKFKRKRIDPGRGVVVFPIVYHLSSLTHCTTRGTKHAPNVYDLVILVSFFLEKGTRPVLI